MRGLTNLGSAVMDPLLARPPTRAGRMSGSRPKPVRKPTMLRRRRPSNEKRGQSGNATSAGRRGDRVGGEQAPFPVPVQLPARLALPVPAPVPLGAGNSAIAGTAASPKAGAGLRLTVAARYSKSSPAAASSSDASTVAGAVIGCGGVRTELLHLTPMPTRIWSWGEIGAFPVQIHFTNLVGPPQRRPRVHGRRLASAWPWDRRRATPPASPRPARR